MEFDDASKEIAMRAKNAAEKRANRLEKRASKKKKENKKNDLLARVGELRKSVTEINNMETSTEYMFSIIIASNTGPETKPVNDEKNIQIAYDEGSVGSLLHELRHGNQIMTGELNFMSTGSGIFIAGESYGVNDEISAYRVQYAYIGRFDLAERKGPPFPEKGKDDGKGIDVKNIKMINANLINKIAKGRWGDERGRRLYKINRKGWNDN